ncbi:acid phosphatase [Comamonas composti]|uniref:acid phosphatase n=1 Tax=Comamonas composti TaxID=408558 RepID=UPI0003FA8760|nr:phosphatase PAP2 family protein [Comamonas composti]
MNTPLLPLTLAAALLASACTTVAPASQPPTSAEQVGELRPGSGYLRGYLERSELPDSLALLPPPPAQGSAALAADEQAFRTLTALRGGERGVQAYKDAQLKFPQAASAFSCALGVEVSQKNTPHLNMLLRRTLGDAGLATYKAKDKYQRIRPFVAFKQATCTPEDEAALSKDGSYPSGHSAIGWAWALVLTEAAPERGDALLQRGRAFAQSRGVCGVHWLSDIEAGRLVGSAAVARLHGNAVFQAQLAAARQEIAQARQKGWVPAAESCAAEAQALKTSVQLAP